MIKMLPYFLSFCLLFFGNWIQAQPPQGISYQAIVRNALGAVLGNQPVAIRFSIRNGSTSGSIVYQETHGVSTNTMGLVNVQIGNGVVAFGSFSNIDWSNGSKYLQVEIDTAGGSNYADLSTQQMMSVPYALFAQKAGSTTGGTSSATTTINGYYFYSSNTYYWGQALSVPAGLSYGGYSDWRLPSQEDLIQLFMKYGSNVFPVDQAGYWTSTFLMGNPNQVGGSSAAYRPIMLVMNSTDYNGSNIGPYFTLANPIPYSYYNNINPDKARVVLVR